MGTPSENPWEQVFQRAVQLHGAGRLDDAGALFAEIAQHFPGHFPSLHRLAAIRRQQGRLPESIALLESAIAANPNSPEIHNTLGNTLSALSRHEEAIAQYRRAIEIRDNLPEVHVNLGNALKAAGRYEEAADAYRAAIALRPAYAEAHSNLGIVLARANRPAEAVESFRATIAIDPAIKLAYSNLGNALTALNRHEEALAYFQQARRLEPDSPTAAFNEAHVHLATGDFARGWRDYEARWRTPGFSQKAAEFAQPLWDGRAEIAGKTILLHSEQGLGDTILFARFVEPVAAHGARVLLNVQKPLTRLMRSIPNVAEVIAAGAAIPAFDLHAPFGTLPLALQTTVETIPRRMPYLHAPAESPTTVDLDRSADKRPLIGISWAGNPEHRDDHNRSIPLALFERLLQNTAVRFVSLQRNLRKGDGEILARHSGLDLTSDLKGSDLADTAALIGKLDLVITVDTVIAHFSRRAQPPHMDTAPVFRLLGVDARSRGQPLVSIRAPIPAERDRRLDQRARSRRGSAW